MTVFDRIKKLLEEADISYELSVHKPAKTSQEATKLTGWPITSGAKSLVLKVENTFVLCVVRGSNKLDYGKVRKHFKARKARFATAEEVYEQTGVEIGSCYPFGSIAGLPMIVDKTLAENELISFSPGTETDHIRITWKDYQKLVKPLLVDITV